MMVDVELERAVRAALKKAQSKGDLPAFELPEQVGIERPKQAEMGDYATPVCMQLARLARMAPIKIAEQVVRRLPEHPAIAAVEVAHPGFINFRLATSWLTDPGGGDPIRRGRLRLRGRRPGAARAGRVRERQPHRAAARGFGAQRRPGDAIAAVLSAAGYQVDREYYVNDAGSRMLAFYETLYARYAQAFGRDEEVPEEGYHGQNMVELGAEIAAEEGDRFLSLPREEALQHWAGWAASAWSRRPRKTWRSWVCTMSAGSRSSRCTMTASTRV